MKHLNKLVAVLFSSMMISMFYPLTVKEYPSQIAIEEEEKQGFQIKSLTNLTKENIANSLKDSKLAKGSALVFFSNMESFYNTKAFSEADAKQICKAITLAAKIHKDDYYVNQQQPYIERCLAVANNLMLVGSVYDSDQITAAILMGPAQQNKLSLEEIETSFGPKVKSLVKELLPSSKETSLIDTLRGEMLDIKCKSKEASQILLADKLHFLTSLVYLQPEQAKQAQIWVNEIASNASDNVNPMLKKAIEDIQINEQ